MVWGPPVTGRLLVRIPEKLVLGGNGLVCKFILDLGNVFAETPQLKLHLLFNNYWLFHPHLSLFQISIFISPQGPFNIWSRAFNYITWSSSADCICKSSCISCNMIKSNMKTATKWTLRWDCFVSKDMLGKTPLEDYLLTLTNYQLCCVFAVQQQSPLLMDYCVA